MSRPAIEIKELSRFAVEVHAPRGTFYWNRFATDLDENKDCLVHRYQLTVSPEPVLTDQHRRTWWVKEGLQICHEKPEKGHGLLYVDTSSTGKALGEYIYEHLKRCKDTSLKEFRKALPESY